ncbi:MAG TPA: nucleotidyltransferase domain-containing protein [Bacteroidia bacterium]|jgi:predicted nucleotidyltransferase|nr:nucleotidyltransferase domain-containing protein [Bacteroidia bacterium]
MNDAQFGFKTGDLSAIIKKLQGFDTLQKAVIFGSRAKGNYKNGSDVDIAVWLEGIDVTPEISGLLNDDLPLPYHFDIVNYDTITNKDLTEHIDRVGIVFYERPNT